MSPDIEWHISEESDQETIIKTTPRGPPPWRWLAIGFVMILGIGLGVFYHSIPGPPKPPTPISRLTPTALPPTPTLTPLEAAIDREAQALATFDLKTFVAMQDPNDPWWHQYRFQSGYWEQPEFGPLYTIVDSGTLASNRAWADIIQYRNGQYFRETRFYRSQSNQWMRTRPFLDLWSGKPQTVRTTHFDLVFHAPDAPLVKIITDQFEQAYTQTCADLGCPVDRDGSLPRAMTMTLIFRPDAEQIDMDWESNTFSLPSPRVLGLYFLDLHGSVLGDNTSVTGIAYGLVPMVVAHIASGGEERWLSSRNGDLFVVNIGYWERLRLNMAGTDFPDEVAISYLRTITDVVPLETLWTTPRPYTPTPLPVALDEGWTVIRFIDTKFGPDGVVSFLHAIGLAQSFSQAVEKGLGIRYADFDRQWRIWLKQFIGQ